MPHAPSRAMDGFVIHHYNISLMYKCYIRTHIGQFRIPFDDNMFMTIQIYGYCNCSNNRNN